MTVDDAGLMELEPIERLTMTEAVCRQILGLLSSGHLKPGDKLPPERALAQRLNVGRTTVREALKFLTLSGLLQAKRGRGTYISHRLESPLAEQVEWSLFLSAGDFEQFFEVRQALEVLAARLAAERGTSEEKDAIGVYREYLEMERGDLDRQLEIDLAFHQAIARASHNDLIVRLTGSLHGFMRGFIAQCISGTKHRIAGAFRQHEAIYEAIQAGAPDRAAEAMRVHLAKSLAPVMAGLTQGEESTLESSRRYQDVAG